jgi:hypothetical protein
MRECAGIFCGHTDNALCPKTCRCRQAQRCAALSVYARNAGLRTRRGQFLWWMQRLGNTSVPFLAPSVNSTSWESGTSAAASAGLSPAAASTSYRTRSARGFIAGWPLFGAEVAPKRLPVRLSAQCGRDLIPGPISGTGLAHRQLDRLLSDASGIGGRLDQLLNRRRHTIDRGIFYGTIQGCTFAGVAPVSGFPLCPRGKPTTGITQAGSARRNRS